MRPGSFKPSPDPALFTTRAVLSGSADNFSINSATVIAPSPKVTPERLSLSGSGARLPGAGSFVRPPTRPGKPQSRQGLQNCGNEKPAGRTGGSGLWKVTMRDRPQAR